MYYLNFPIDLGQEYRRMMISNFKHIIERLNYIKDDFHYHRTEEENAHTSSQIKHGSRTSKDTFNDLQSQINRLVLAPRNNSANEIVQARVNMFGNHFNTLKENINDWQERTHINKKETISEINQTKKELLDIEYRFEPNKQEDDDQEEEKAPSKANRRTTKDKDVTLDDFLSDDSEEVGEKPKRPRGKHSV